MGTRQEDIALDTMRSAALDEVVGSRTAMPCVRINRWMWGAGFVLLASTLAAVNVAAENERRLSVVLGYEVDAGLRGCPTEAELHRAVSDQLGYDPFRSKAAHRVVASVQGSERGIDGQIVWTDEAGSKEGERRLGSANRDCASFMRGMTFAIAVQIQLLNATAPRETETRGTTTPVATPSDAGAVAPPDAEAATTAAVSATTGTTRLPSPPSSAASDLVFTLGLGPTLLFGAAPSMALGGRVFVDLRWSALSIEGGGEGILPVTFEQADRTGFRLRTVDATLALCGHVGRWAACAVGSLGPLRVEGFGVDEARSPSSVLAKAGLRLILEQPLSRRFAVRLRADGLGTLTPATVYLNDVSVWTTPRLALGLGTDLAVRFP